MMQRGHDMERHSCTPVLLVDEGMLLLLQLLQQLLLLPAAQAPRMRRDVLAASYMTIL